MQKMFLYLIRFYFKLFSNIFPQKIANQAIKLFQKPKSRAVKPEEQAFFDYARNFKVTFENELLDAYEIGEEHTKLVIIVHGWGSNLGRLSALALRLEKEGYRIIGLNFPAHGFSKTKYTNMVYCKNALNALFLQLNIQQDFSLIAHSFGSGVSAMSLAELQLPINTLVFMTSANQIEDIFLDFKKMVSLGEKPYQIMVKRMEKLSKLAIKDFSVQNFLKHVQYNQLYIFHDKFDKVLPYQFATSLHANTINATLITLENKGHSGMLYDAEVIEKTVQYIKQSL